MGNKVAAQKSKTVVVVTFGSEDNFEMPTALDYKAVLDRLGQMNPGDIRALPTVLAGNKILKLEAKDVVICEGETWTFKPTRSIRSRPDIENDTFVQKAMIQLDGFLKEGKPRFVLVPYYAKLEKRS